MERSIFRFTLNMHKHNSQISIPVVFGDTAVRLYISISDGVNVYYIENGCYAVLSGKKADGTTLKNYCAIEDNTRIVYDFTEHTANCEGLVDCTITLYGPDGGIITAPKFILMVDERVVYDIDVPVSDDEKTALDQIFIAEAERIKAEEDRASAETSRNDAEKIRAENETARISAEETRANNEDCRVQAESERVKAEEERRNAENERKAAEDERGKNFAEKLKPLVEEAKGTIENVTNENLSKAIVHIENTADSVLKETDARLTNIENHINPKFFLTDSAVAYYKYVPEKICPNARLNYIGGASKYGDNISAQNITVNSSFANLTLASVTVDEKQFYLLNPGSDKTEIYVRKDSDGGEILHRISEETNVYLETGVYYFTLERNGELNESIVVSPTIKKFYPDTKVTAVNVLPANLIPLPYTSHQAQRRVMEPGIFNYKSGSTNFKFSVESDGRIVAHYNILAATLLYLMDGTVSFSKDVLVSGISEENLKYARLSIRKADNSEYDSSVKAEHTITANTPFKICIVFNGGVDVSNLVIKPTIVCKDTKKPLTYPVSDYIQSLQGYGESNPTDASEYNYINCKIQKFVAKGQNVDGVWERNDKPIETPISFDKFIDVESEKIEGTFIYEGTAASLPKINYGNIIEFVNESEGAVPSSITYMLKDVETTESEEV